MCVFVCLFLCLSDFVFICVSVISETWKTQHNSAMLFHQCGELHLVSCTDCFSSWHDALFETKGFQTFSQVTCDTMPFMLEWCNTL